MTHVNEHARLRFTEDSIAKARRLLAAGALERASLAEVYTVAGDHGRYIVVVSADRRYATCSCPASLATCSHTAAVLLSIAEGVDVPVYEADDGNPFDGLTDSTRFEWEVDR